MLIHDKLQAKESRIEMKLVLCRLLKELGQVCFACFCCIEAWQRWGDQIKLIINNTLFSKCLFLMALAKWQEQFKGCSPRNKALAPHKQCSKRPHEGQLGGGKGRGKK